MKENQYDHPGFFAAYSRFPRSVKGLSAAGEWHALRALLPDFTGKRVLDIGCGFGWHCGYAAQQGAAYVLGIDLSASMLAAAGEKNPHPSIEYRRLAMEDMEFPPQSFDVVISSLALHYAPDFGDICGRVGRCLPPGGAFVFSVEHPIFTAQGPQAWVYDNGGRISHWPVDRYFDEGRRDAVFLGEPITKYHKTLETYITALLDNGFALRALVEPKPEAGLLETVPGMEDELRRPMMLILSAVKA